MKIFRDLMETSGVVQQVCHISGSVSRVTVHNYVSALDWQSLPERICSRTPASTVLYRTGHSVINYSFAVVLCVSESVKDIFRLHAYLQDSSLFPHLLITTWPSTTADYGVKATSEERDRSSATACICIKLEPAVMRQHRCCRSHVYGMR
ncbi:hypothetical protein J6590_028740 [Homalodisca vitripennis]|nr:hypothetical protein J6590_028740 [Homalodisca vitripennis]